MIKGFEGYYPPDFNKLWNEAVFVFDTNVLLDLFRYSQNSRKDLLGILEKLDDRIWIPHQFFYEYHRNKMTVHYTIADAYIQGEKQLEKCSSNVREQMNSLRNVLQSLKNRTGVEIDPRIEKVDEIFAEIQSELSRSKEQHQSSLNDEPLEEKIAHLFAENYGDPFDDSCLENIRKLAKERIEKGIPPGSSKDSKKEKSDPNGDLIGWLQTIKHADCKKLPIILVTNDGDWFFNSSGKVIGPHPDLLQEMHDKANVSCYIYRTTEFIKYAEDYLDAQVSDKTIEDAENRERYIAEQERRARERIIEQERRARERFLGQERRARERFIEQERRAMEPYLEEEHRARERIIEQERRAMEPFLEEEHRARERIIEQERRAMEPFLEEEHRARERIIEQERRAMEPFLEEEHRAMEAYLEQERRAREILLDEQRRNAD